MSAHRDDDDPTGIRHLLSGMPDPAPMSDDLVRRISADIEDERRGHRPPETLRFDPAVARPRRRHRAGVAGGVLGMALLLVALPSALLMLRDGAAVVRSSLASSLVLAGAPETPASPTASTPAIVGGTPASRPVPETGPGARARLVSSGTDYRPARFDAQVHDFVVGTTPANPVTGITPDVVDACLGVLGIHEDAVVDLATYEGRPALLIVAPAHDRTDARTATVMPRVCPRSGTVALAGPRPVR